MVTKRRLGMGCVEPASGGTFRARLPNRGKRLPGRFASYEEAAKALDDAVRAGLGSENVRPPTACAEQTSYIYFAKAAALGAIKIGVSKEPAVRVAQLQGGHPFQVELIAVMPGGFATEKAMHAAFSGSRLNGEWFVESPLLMRLIDEWRRSDG